MKLRSVALSFVAVTLLYGLSLFFLDIKSNSLVDIKRSLHLLPFLMLLTFVSFIFRYVRWHWLLSSAGQKIPFLVGFSYYLSGFALTASPGKIGELLRIRYFQRASVPASITISAFFFERACDLLVVLLLGLYAASAFDFFPLIAFTIIVILFCILFLVYKPLYLRLCVYFLYKFRLRKSACLFKVLVRGITGIQCWITPYRLLISLALGGLAWFTLSLSFIWLLSTFDTEVGWLPAMSIYPLAMLAGAVSMLPGGIGSTEAAIVTQLVFYDVPLVLAGLIAISIRIATIWFAILCGLVAVILLELKILSDRELAR